MITWRVLFAVMAMVLAGASGSASVAGPSTRGPASDPSPSSAFDLFSVLEPAIQPHLDVYGNEIEDAITDYRIDTQGEVYELHSPETEVPRLASPIG